MLTYHPLTTFTPTDFDRIASGYTSPARYAVEQYTTPEATSFVLRLVPLAQPYIKVFDSIDSATYQRYLGCLSEGFSFGADYQGELVGVLIAEPHWWNNSLWVWEFHISTAYRRRGIGRQLMDLAADQARRAGLRIIVCETQSTNIPAVHAYQRLGFNLEALDLSYYTNTDYPSGEIALFMKRRLV